VKAEPVSGESLAGVPPRAWRESREAPIELGGDGSPIPPFLLARRHPKAPLAFVDNRSLAD